jgi:ABC-type Fe3+/spermidine/putrescine transport system ATPase subunit
VEADEGGALVCRLAAGPRWKALGAAPVGSTVRLMVRPEALRLGAAGEDAVPATVLDRRFAGAATFFRVGMADGSEALVQGGPSDAAPGDTVHLTSTGPAVAYVEGA